MMQFATHTYYLLPLGGTDISFLYQPGGATSDSIIQHMCSIPFIGLIYYACVSMCV